MEDHLTSTEQGLERTEPTNTDTPPPDEIRACLVWRGKPEHYQEQAAISAIENGMTIMPWCWIDTTCGQPLCIEPTHILIHRPRNLDYPYGLCIYCGEPGWTKDHLLPIATSGTGGRKYILTVPACGECNSLISASHAPSITERRAIATTKLRKKYWKKLTCYEYTDEEIAEFGPGLRPSIVRAQQDKQIIAARLQFPDDLTYDLRYLGKSGIEDPYALGLIRSE